MGYNKRLATPQKQAGGWTNFSELTHPYIQAWTDKMIEIWADRLEQLDVEDTGELKRSVSDHTLTLDDQGAEAAFKFLFYGIYVDLGVGNGYKHGNGGDLEILNPEYRHKHKMGNMRERKPWFNTPWYISKEVMKSKMASLMGEAFVGLLDDLEERYRK